MNSNPQISPETIELIESYLLGAMNAEQKSAFESRLETDDQLRTHTNEFRLISTAIQEQALRDKLNDFHSSTTASLKDIQQPAGKSAVVRSIGWQRWASVAAVVVVIISAWFLLNQPSKEQKVFADFYKPDPGLVTTMGGNEEYEFNHAMIDYKSGKYDSAIVAWKKMQSSDSPGDTLNYFIGSSYMAIGNWETAAKYFEIVTRDEKSTFRSDAYWYAALAYLRIGKKEDALKYLGQTTRKEKEGLIAELSK